MKLENKDKVIKELKLTFNSYEEKTNYIINKYSSKILEDAIKNAPKDTGNLKRNIKNKKSEQETEIYVDEKAYYGFFVHEGHWTNGTFVSKRKIEPNPFLYNAYMQNKDDMLNEIEKIIK